MIKNIKSEGIIKHFEELEAPRDGGGNKKHDLIEIIVIAISAVISGADSWDEIEMFSNAKIDWFKTLFKLENGIPSHDTFSRVFSRPDPKKVQ